MEMFTIAEAAEATGLTKKALRNRVDRGQVRSVLREGMRHIPRSELERAGLLLGGHDEAGAEAAEAVETANGGQDASSLEAVIDNLHDRLEKQAAELGRLRLLTEQADSLKAAALETEQRAHEALEAEYHAARAQAGAFEAELHDARARIAVLESAARPASRRWWPFGGRRPEAAAS
jgi:chromosome segregation ATPase